MEPNENQNAKQHESTPQNTPPTNTAPVDNNTLMAALSYFGPLVIIPYLTSKENSFVLYHIKQGVVLLIADVIIFVISSLIMYGALHVIISLLNLGTLILAIIGIINALQKKEAPLPLIGQFADKVKI